MGGWEGDNHLVAAFVTPTGQAFWTKNQYDRFMQAAVDFWEQESRGLVSFEYTPYEQVPLVASASLCAKALTPAALATAQAYGHATTAAFWAAQEPRTHLVMIRPVADSMLTCPTWTATDRRQITVSVDVAGPSAKQLQSLAHEIGHDFGLDHTGGARCPTGVVDGPFTSTTSSGACSVAAGSLTDDQYNDFLTIMGNTNQSIARFGISSQQKEDLGIITEGAGLTTVASGDTTFVLKPSNALVAVGTPTAQALQALNVIDHVGTATRQYSVGFDKTAGGIAIRRVMRADDPEANLGYVDTVLLNPGTTKVGNRMVFAAGEVFTASSGRFTLRVEKITSSSATVRVSFNTVLPAVAVTPASDDYPSTKDTAATWNTVASPRLSGTFETAEDEDWFRFTAPSTGHASIVAVAPVGSIWLDVSQGVQVGQALSSPQTAGDLFVTFPVTKGLVYHVKAAPSYGAPTLLPGAYTLEARLPTAGGLTLSTTSWAAPAAGGTLAVTVTTGGVAGLWTAASDSSGVAGVGSGLGRSGEAFTVQLGANPYDYARADRIVVTGPDGQRGVLTVSQAASSSASILIAGSWELRKSGRYIPVPTDWPFLKDQTWTAERASTQLCGARAQTSQATWTATSSAAWLSTTPTSGTNYTSVCVVTEENTTGQVRTGTVKWQAGAASWTLTVRQVAQATLTLPESIPAVGGGGGKLTVQLGSIGAPWLAYPSRDAWLSVSPSGGSGPATLTLTAQPNQTGQRVVNLVVVSAGETVTVQVTQLAFGQEPTPTATPTPTKSATPTATKTATPTATKTATPTPTKTATPTATKTATPTATKSATPTATKTATPTATKTATPTPTKSATPTATPTATGGTFDTLQQLLTLLRALIGRLLDIVPMLAG
jgi:hypothetical protein